MSLLGEVGREKMRKGGGGQVAIMIAPGGRGVVEEEDVGVEGWGSVMGWSWGLRMAGWRGLGMKLSGGRRRRKKKSKKERARIGRVGGSENDFPTKGFLPINLNISQILNFFFSPELTKMSSEAHVLFFSDAIYLKCLRKLLGGGFLFSAGLACFSFSKAPPPPA